MPSLPPIGLVSVTFRQLGPASIVDLAKKNGLGLIEWAGDVHVPPGDLLRAREVGVITRSAGLQVAAYGSYYRLGSESEIPFATVLETALALGAPVIRVWAGNIGSDTADENVWQHVCHEAERTAALAAEAGVSVALEFHGGTLNDTPAAARRLWARLSHLKVPNLRSLWQPLPTLSPVEQDESLVVVLPHLSHVHVFHWLPGPPIVRRPLAEGFVDWSRWLAVIQAYRPGIPSLLEFIPDDAPADFPAEAATLQRLIAATAVEN